MAKKDRRYLAIVAIAFLVAIYISLKSPTPNFTLPTPSELSTVGYVPVQVSVALNGNRGVVALTGNCYQVTGDTDPWIVDAIAKGQAGQVDVRPSVYDVAKDELNALGVKVLMVKVIAVQNSTFIGRLILQQGNKIVSLDSRPSDATAIAVRVGAPVYIKQDLMTTYGQKVC